MNTLVTQQATGWDIEIPVNGTQKTAIVKLISTKTHEPRNRSQSTIELIVVPQALLTNKMCHRVSAIHNSSTDKAFNSSNRSRSHRHWWWVFKTSRPIMPETYQMWAVSTSTQHLNSTGWVSLISMRIRMAPRTPKWGHPSRTNSLEPPSQDQEAPSAAPVQ